MHRRLILAVAPLLLTGCGTQQPPAYTPANVTEQTTTGYAELIYPDADTAEARDAIAHYTAGINDQKLYYVKVTRTEDADRYVCRARWYRDADAYRQHGDGQTPPTSWPHITINCP